MLSSRQNERDDHESTSLVGDVVLRIGPDFHTGGLAISRRRRSSDRKRGRRPARCPLRRGRLAGVAGEPPCRSQVEKKVDAVWVHLPWRRRDEGPEKKEITIIDAASNQRVKNCLRVRIDAESGDLLFQPPAPGTYYVYYMPFRTEGEWYFPRTVYLLPTDTADAAWKAACSRLFGKSRAARPTAWPRAKVVEFQAINEFHRFDPMEVPATRRRNAETVGRASRQALSGLSRRSPPADPHDRRPAAALDPIGAAEFVARRSVPWRVLRVSTGRLRGDAGCDRHSLRHETVSWCNGRGGGLGEITSFNTAGKDWLGRPFVKRVSVGRGRVQPLWFGVQVPRDAAAGEYRTTVTLQPQGLAATQIEVVLLVTGRVLDDAGDGDLWRYSRLRWLNSTIGLDDEADPPYLPRDRFRLHTALAGPQSAIRRDRPAREHPEHVRPIARSRRCPAAGDSGGPDSFCR